MNETRFKKIIMKHKWVIFILLAALQTAANANHSTTKEAFATITIVMPDAAEGDSLYLSIFSYGLSNKSADTIIAASQKGSTFSFRVKIAQAYQYFSLNKKYGATGVPIYLLNNYIIEKNDNVTITFNQKLKEEPANLINYSYFIPITECNKYDLTFNGKGSLKYKCRYNIDKTIVENSSAGISIIDSNGIFISNGHPDLALHNVHPYLNAHRTQLGSNVYQQLLTDITSVLECERLYFYGPFALSWYKKNNFRHNINYSYEALKAEKEKLTTPSSRLASPYYSYWQAMYYKIFTSGFPDKSLYNESTVTPTVQKIRKDFTGELGDKIITTYLFSCARIVSNTVADTALALVKTNYCISALKKFNAANEGYAAQNFRLTDTAGRQVSLKDFTGKTVFIDFWFIGCGGCAKYYKEVLKPVEQKYIHDTSVVFITININTSKADWIQAIQSDVYTSENCVNLNTGIQGGAHSVIRDYDVRDYPRPYLINKKGYIISSNSTQLRFNGVNGLINLIEKAKS